MGMGGTGMGGGGGGYGSMGMGAPSKYNVSSEVRFLGFFFNVVSLAIPDSG